MDNQLKLDDLKVAKVAKTEKPGHRLKPQGDGQGGEACSQH